MRSVRKSGHYRPSCDADGTNANGLYRKLSEMGCTRYIFWWIVLFVSNAWLLFLEYRLACDSKKLFCHLGSYSDPFLPIEQLTCLLLLSYWEGDLSCLLSILVHLNDIKNQETKLRTMSNLMTTSVISLLSLNFLIV